MRGPTERLKINYAAFIKCNMPIGRSRVTELVIFYTEALLGFFLDLTSFFIIIFFSPNIFLPVTVNPQDKELLLPEREPCCILHHPIVMYPESEPSVFAKIPLWCTQKL